jgi:lysyl-tRNA synthetase class 2
MEVMLASVYRDWIVETGKEPELFLLVAFLVTFGFIRTSTHMIRAQVRWWPGNVSFGGTHVHHLVWGILLVLAVGYVAIALAPGSPGREILAVLFGVGAALTLDEFALWLNLKDVYWTEKGRSSIDAVIIAAALAGIVLVGLRAWLDVADDVAILLQAAIGSAVVVRAALSLVNAVKGRYVVAAIGMLIPVVGIVSAFRPPKPGSLWARARDPARRTTPARRRRQAPPTPRP